MGANRAGAIRKQKLRRRRRQVKRFVEQCAAANREEQSQGKPPTDFSREIREVSRLKNWPE